MNADGCRRGSYRLIVSVSLDRHEILVIGGGAVAERKIATLLRSGARVRLVSPDAVPPLAKLALDGKIIWEKRAVRAEDFAGHKFAVAATPRHEAERVASLAQDAGCLVDVCSDGEIGDFALCAQFEIENCFVGVSSGGGNPARAAQMKREIIDAMKNSDISPLRVLTRNSPLARVQADLWMGALAGLGVPTEARAVTSHGDRDRVSDLSAFGFGAFVKALEDELLSGRGDCAVHSLKDVPTALPESCELAGVLKRGSVRDILISSDGRDLNSLPSGAKIGTSSVRRRAQMRNVRPDLEFVTCRGNINTRLEKLKRGEIDALVLAEVGLERLGVDPGHAFPLPFLTAAGQGAVASEALRGSPAMEILRSLNHIPTWYEITSERAFLAHTGSGCACPIGVRGIYEDGELELAVEAYFIDPKRSGEPEKASVRGRVDSEEDAVSLGDRLWDMTRLSPVFLSYAAAEGGAS